MSTRWVWALLPPTLLSVCATWLIVTDSWALVGIEHVFGIPWADLVIHTATADCARLDPSWSLSSETCDPIGRTYNYPSIWVALYSGVGATMMNTGTFALIQAALFVLAIAGVSFAAVSKAANPLLVAVGLTVATFAPPTWLALERGNNEVLVFCLVTGSLLLMVQGRFTSSAVLIGIASVLKIYPIGGLSALLPNRVKSRTPLVASLIVTVVGGVAVVPDLKFVAAGTPQPTDGAFGASVLVRIEGLPFPRFLGILIFFTVTAMYIIAFKYLATRSCRNGIRNGVGAIQQDTTSTALLLLGGGPLVVAYILGSNFDYRLLLTTLLVAGLMRHYQFQFIRILVLMLVICLYGTYPAPPSVQYFADVLWVFLMPTVALLTLKCSKAFRSFD